MIHKHSIILPALSKILHFTQISEHYITDTTQRKDSAIKCMQN